MGLLGYCGQSSKNTVTGGQLLLILRRSKGEVDENLITMDPDVDQSHVLCQVDDVHIVGDESLSILLEGFDVVNSALDTEIKGSLDAPRIPHGHIFDGMPDEFTAGSDEKDTV